MSHISRYIRPELNPSNFYSPVLQLPQEKTKVILKKLLIQKVHVYMHDTLLVQFSLQNHMIWASWRKAKASYEMGEYH